MVHQPQLVAGKGVPRVTFIDAETDELVDIWPSNGGTMTA
jgi:hypothetical protein